MFIVSDKNEKRHFSAPIQRVARYVVIYVSIFCVLALWGSAPAFRIVTLSNSFFVFLRLVKCAKHPCGQTKPDMNTIDIIS